jgi:hypothetical protein
MWSVNITAKDLVLVSCLLSVLRGVSVDRDIQALLTCSIKNTWKVGRKLLMPFIKKDLISLSKSFTLEELLLLKQHEDLSHKLHHPSPSETFISLPEKITKFLKK